ncbi:MAG: sensor histidine kinase, partial [Anaerolineales bacterium]
RGALAEMRTLLLELRPSALLEAEADELFRHLCDAFTGRALVAVNCSLEGECEMPSDVKIAFYRIAQEALNNVAKHAQATQVQMSLVCTDSKVEMDIRDDGRGFDPAEVPSDHLGVKIMQERADAIGAELKINTLSGEGTQVWVRWQAA